MRNFYRRSRADEIHAPLKQVVEDIDDTNGFIASMSGLGQTNGTIPPDIHFIEVVDNLIEEAKRLFAQGNYSVGFAVLAQARGKAERVRVPSQREMLMDQIAGLEQALSHEYDKYVNRLWHGTSIGKSIVREGGGGPMMLHTLLAGIMGSAGYAVKAAEADKAMTVLINKTEQAADYIKSGQRTAAGMKSMMTVMDVSRRRAQEAISALPEVDESDKAGKAQDQADFNALTQMYMPILTQMRVETGTVTFEKVPGIIPRLSDIKIPSPADAKDWFKEWLEGLLGQTWDAIKWPVYIGGGLLGFAIFYGTYRRFKGR